MSGVEPAEASFLIQRSARTVLRALFLLLVAVVPAVSTFAETGTRAPNVLLIMTDDQGWGDLGVHGNEKIETPVIDAFAAESVRLDRFFVSPVCAPTRAALLTGRYPERSGVAGVSERLEIMDAAETTIAETFSAAGYRTGCFGKWHNGAQSPNDPLSQGFESFFGFCAGHWNLYDDPIMQSGRQMVQTKGYITDVITDHAIEFLTEGSAQPFLCYVPFNAPHGPFQVRQDLFDKYNDGSIDEKTAAVYGMVENIDSNVGRLLETLEKKDATRETIVVFLTDNGPNGTRFNGGMRGVKGSIHEGGTRVPCFIRWPETLQPRTIGTVAAHVDLLPTLSGLCGVPIRGELPLDGRNLSKLVRTGGDAEIADRQIVILRPNRKELGTVTKAAVRSQQYRLTIEKGRGSLFDMSADPNQKFDIAGSHPDVVADLQQTLKDYVAEIVPVIVKPRSVPVRVDVAGDHSAIFTPAVDATMTGNPNFANHNGWSHDWIENWTSSDDSVNWTLDVQTPGRYEVILHYVCPVEADGVRVSASVAGAKLSVRMNPFASQRSVRPELDSKSAPRLMQVFAQQALGVVDLPASGDHPLTLQLSAESDAPFHLEVGGLSLRPCELPLKQDLDLYVLAGQSNMAGRGAVEPQDESELPRLLAFSADRTWGPATDPLHFDKPRVVGVGPGREFGVVIAQADESRTVGLIPCAVGGSAIATWRPGALHASTKTHPLDDAIARIRAASAYGKVKAVLWHQGESDSSPAKSRVYKEELQRVIETLRSEAGSEPIVLIGQLGQFPEKPWNESRALIDQSHQQLAAELPRAAFVSSDDLTCKSDLTHFSAASARELGRRFAAAYLNLIDSAAE